MAKRLSSAVRVHRAAVKHAKRSLGLRITPRRRKKRK